MNKNKQIKRTASKHPIKSINKKRIVATIIAAMFVLGGCSYGERINEGASSVFYHHDDVHKVGCWTAYSSAISCLPDSEYMVGE